MNITLVKEKTTVCKDEKELRDIAFKTMLRQDNYRNGEFIAGVYYGGYAFQLYKEKDGTLSLLYHKEHEYPAKHEVFWSVGGIWAFIFEKVLKIEIK